MQNFQIELSHASEKFYEPGLYQLQYFVDNSWILAKNKEDKNIEYLIEYPISEFELKEIFNSLYNKINNISQFNLKIIRIPHEHETTG